METISLRAYQREIEGLIKTGQFADAISHCRHILKSFPKSVATYRLLGKACLENQQLEEASDVFQRVLSSIPDDMTANLAMSVIRQEQGRLDEAIGFMERAFETQPANPKIQQELRQLYGKRDGLEPPKVRLTRAALARMYLKGELVQQAIAELHVAIKENPERIDLQILLARAYTQAGKYGEAANTCSGILVKLPFCLEANRVMTEVLANTEKADQIPVYRQRFHELDPYAAFLGPNALTPEKVPDQAVTLEKLDLTVAPVPAEEETLPISAEIAQLPVAETGDEVEISAPEPIAGIASETPSAEVSPVETQPTEWQPEEELEVPQAEPEPAIASDWFKGVIQEVPEPTPAESEIEPEEIAETAPVVSLAGGAELVESAIGSEESAVETVSTAEGRSEWVPEVELAPAEVPTTIEEITESHPLVVETIPVSETPGPEEITVTPPATPEVPEWVTAMTPPEIPVQATPSVSEEVSAPQVEGAPETPAGAAVPEWINEILAEEMPPVEAEPEIQAPVEEAPVLVISEAAVEAPPVQVVPVEVTPEIAPVEVITPVEEGVEALPTEAVQLPEVVTEIASVETYPEITPVEVPPIEAVVEALPTDAVQLPEEVTEIAPVETILEFTPIEAVVEALPTEAVQLPEAVTEIASVESYPEITPVEVPPIEAVVEALPTEVEQFPEVVAEVTPVEVTPETATVEVAPSIEAIVEALPTEAIQQPEVVVEVAPVETVLEAAPVEDVPLIEAVVEALPIEAVRLPEVVAEAAPVEIAPEVPPGVSLQPIALPEPAVPPVLDAARQALKTGNLDLALDHYGNLINTHQDLPEVIQDLKQALDKEPQNQALWQHLGDAYLRADQLQEALEAYLKAEELIK